MSFAIVFDMPDEYEDPSGNTEAFRAFAQSPETAGGRPAASRLPLIVTVAVLVVVVLAVIAWFALG